MQSIGLGRPSRQDTYDLRDQLHPSDTSLVHAHADANNYIASDEEHSVLEDDSDQEMEHDQHYIDEDEDDDGSSSLSVPNESIDFDLVYSLHSFAATVEGQANVVKGDSLFLMDDSNSYWWLVRVLKTQEVGYIPAENIETPFERLARLNKHRNVDLASATQSELQDEAHASRDRLRTNLVSSRSGSHSQSNTPSPVPVYQKTPGPRPGQELGVIFTPALYVHRYPPAIWGEEDPDEDEDEWDDEPYEDEDPDLADDLHHERVMAERAGLGGNLNMGVPAGAGLMGMEPDDGMSWDDSVAEDMQALAAQTAAAGGMLPTALQAGQGQRGDMPSQQSLFAQQQQQQLLVNQQKALQSQQGQVEPQTQILRQQTSRERLTAQTDGKQSASPGSPGRPMVDPADATETRKLTVTPSVAREREAPLAPAPSTGPLLPSAILQKQEEERKRTREEIEALEEASRKRSKSGKNGSISYTNLAQAGVILTPTGSKPRKDPQPDEESVKEKDKDKGGDKKKRGIFGGLFGSGKKDKSKDKNGSIASADGGSVDLGRGSSESGRSSNQNSTHTTEVPPAGPSPVTAAAISQQQSMASSLRNSTNPKQIVIQQQQLQTPQGSPQDTAPISQHASQLRQRDQQQQALYKQYLTHSPSSPPEASSTNYGLQTLQAVLPGSNSFNSSAGSAAGLGLPSTRPRPGSLILSPSAMDGQGVGVPDLSVIRVFAGLNVQTEATFKTVLLNSSTTSSDLIRQAMQRFRLPGVEDENDYFLTVKQVEGSSATLLPHEHPLGVFETLVEAAMELPKVKRSSVGSISSVASNLSMHPAIRKLSMNDFTDDSAVKFYLNRKGDDSVSGSLLEDEGDETLMAEYSRDSQRFSVNSLNNDRFSSPSFRFALQLVIYPDDLPEDMVFHPLTEAIVFRNSLSGKSHSGASSSPGLSQSMRRKVFMFPKNATVAEVIELGLERFGISDGVVDGGDEVEDKTTKRRSSVRVRYGLTVDIGVQERELSPSSRVIDAYPKPPTYRPSRLSDTKRRSADSALLLGNVEDVGPDDPIFVLRRAVSYRNSNSRHRLSAPLDEIALSHLHRESAASGSSYNSEADDKPKQLSRQELIAAQRAASRANQKSILSAQTNSVRGMDVLLPGNAMIRSSRYESGDRMRYSYVEPDGETYDISDIVEEEWLGDDTANKNDLLEGALVRNKDGLGDNFDRVLSKIKVGKANGRVPTTQSFGSMRSTSSSEYSVDTPDKINSRSTTPLSGFTAQARTPTPTAGLPRAASPANSRKLVATVPDGRNSRSRTNTPNASKPATRRNPSIASVMSDMSGYGTPASHLPNESPSPDGSPRSASTARPNRKRLYLPKDDFGLSHMLTIIQLGGAAPKVPAPPIDHADELLFGRTLDLNSLHPQVRDIYADSLKHLEAMDKTLDDFISRSIPVS